MLTYLRRMALSHGHGERFRLPDSAHTSRPWRIHELTADFRLEDVWALPTPGARDDFPRLVNQFAPGDPSRTLPVVARALWALRVKLGALLGWDGDESDAAPRTPTVGDRLPHDLRDGPAGPAFATLPFTSLYMLENECAAEAANRTMQGILHLGWVEDPAGGYRGQ